MAFHSLQRCKIPSENYNNSPEAIRLSEMTHVQNLHMLRSVENFLSSGASIFATSRHGSSETDSVPMFAGEIRTKRVYHRSFSLCRWRLHKKFVRLNGEML